MTVLVTGGTGYIGSHTCVVLLENGYNVVAVDDLSNSSEEALRRVEKITGKQIEFYKADVCDGSALDIKGTLPDGKVSILARLLTEE